MIEFAGDVDLLMGFVPTTSLPPINHLQFVDGTLIFCGAKEEQIWNVKAILLPLFFFLKVVSGLKVNFFKSELLGVRISYNRLGELALIFFCKAGSLPATYLGLPLCILAVSHPMVSGG